jgi:RHH-type rel operon transcriptional repressor/antitoxin RelB
MVRSHPEHPRMPHPLSIRLDEELEARLERLSRLTGRSKSFYVKQALQDQIEDLEDLYLARRVARRVEEGRERLVPIEDLEIGTSSVSSGSIESVTTA